MKVLLGRFLIVILALVMFGNVCLAGDSGEIGLNVKSVDGGLTRVDVLIEGVNKPILGLGFHLIFDSHVFKFLRYEPGELLESGGDEPIYIVKDNEGAIVVGASLKRGDVLPVMDGRIISLIFEGDFDLKNAEFQFEKPVISSLEQERRVDLNDVSWSGAGNVMQVSSRVSADMKGGDEGTDFEFWYMVMGGASVVLLVLIFLVEMFSRK